MKLNIANFLNNTINRQLNRPNFVMTRDMTILHQAIRLRLWGVLDKVVNF